MNIFSSVTHAIVTTFSKEDADKTGCVASVDLCLGTDGIVGGFRYIKREGKMEWHAPVIEVPANQDKIQLPVFTGKVLADACRLCSRSIERIREEFGRPAWDAKYVIFRDKIDVTTKGN